MNKEEVLNKYKNEKDSIFVAKLLDKIKFAIKKNKITNTDFLDIYQKEIAKKILEKCNVNYIFYRGK